MAAQTAMRAEAERRLVKLAQHDTVAFCSAHKPKVKHPTRGLIPFAPHDYQRRLLRSLDSGGRPVVLKARQIGISTTVMIQKLRRCLGEPATTVVTVSAAEKYAKELIRIARDAFAGLECGPPVKLTTDNTLELAWDNGSRIMAMSASPNPGRGIAASDIVLDEFAYWPWQAEMWRAIRPTVSLGGNACIISTPDMEGDLFHDRWLEAQAGNGWVPFSIPWQQCPEYGEEWRQRESADYTAAGWAQEYECQFGRSGDGVFKGEYIDAALELAAVTAPAQDGPREYVFGGDLAGEGRDETVFVILDVTTRPATIADVWSVEVAPAPVLQDKVAELAAQYACTPWLDRTGIGWGIVQNLNIPAVGLAITGGQAVGGDRDAPNVPRTRLINNLVLGLEQGQIAVPAGIVKLVAGLRSYRWDKRRGKCPDWVDALAIAWWAHTQGTTPLQVW